MPDTADIFSEEMGDGREVLGGACGSDTRGGVAAATLTASWPTGVFVGATSISGIKMGAGIDFFKAPGA